MSANNKAAGAPTPPAPISAARTPTAAADTKSSTTPPMERLVAAISSEPRTTAGNKRAFGPGLLLPADCRLILGLRQLLRDATILPKRAKRLLDAPRFFFAAALPLVLRVAHCTN